MNVVSPDDDTMKALKKHKFVLPADLTLDNNELRWVSNMGGDKHYDQIAFLVRKGELELGSSKSNAGVLNYYKAVYTDDDAPTYFPLGKANEKWPDTATKRKTYFAREWRTWQMSDHLPPRAAIDFTEQYSSEFVKVNNPSVRQPGRRTIEWKKDHLVMSSMRANSLVAPYYQPSPEESVRRVASRGEPDGTSPDRMASDWIVMDPDIDFAAPMNAFDTIIMGERPTRQRDSTLALECPANGLRCLRTLRQEDCPVLSSLTIRRKQWPRSSSHRKDIWLFGGGSLFRSLPSLAWWIPSNFVVILSCSAAVSPLPPSERPTKLKLRSTASTRRPELALEYLPA
jgi:hypothetical protein